MTAASRARGGGGGVSDVDVTRFDFIDYPLGWELAKAIPMGDHHPKCSFRQTNGAILCDCAAILIDWKRRREALGLSSDGYDDMIAACEAAS